MTFFDLEPRSLVVVAQRLAAVREGLREPKRGIPEGAQVAPLSNRVGGVPAVNCSVGGPLTAVDLDQQRDVEDADRALHIAENFGNLTGVVCS